MFKVKKSNILNKILYLEKYLKECSADDLKNGKSIKKDKLKELSSVFNESDDIKQLEKSLKNIYKKINSNSDSEISNSELLMYEDILNEVGISANELMALFERYNESVGDDLNNIDAKELIDSDVKNFKETIKNYPRLSEIIKDAGYDKFFELVDENSDGIFSEDELEKIGDSDKNNKTITFEDIENFLNDNDIEVKDVSKEINDEIDEFEKKDSDKEKETKDTSGSSGVLSGGSSGGSIGGSSGGSLSSASSAAPSNKNSQNTKTDTKTSGSVEEQITELKQEKETKQGEIDSFNSDLDNAYNGTDSEIANQKTAMDEAEENYKSLLEDEAENNPEVEQLKEELEENENNIKQEDDNIKTFDENIVSIQQEISQKESTISGLENEKSALEASLSEINSTQETEYNKEEIAAKKSELKSLIDEKNTEIEQAKNELQELQTQKEEYEKQLKESQEKKAAYEEERNTIEEEIKNTASDALKTALEDFQEARQEFETAKTNRIDKIKSDISANQNEINSIDSKIQELEAQKIKEENQLSPWGSYNAERGEALAQAANSLYGGVSHGGGLCATGVSQAINQAFGYVTYGNGCDYGNTLSQLDDWVEITNMFNSADELVNLPAGAVVSWSPYNTTSSGSIYGHVFIADGQGHGISDFKEDISTYYADRGSQYRVFIPV